MASSRVRVWVAARESGAWAGNDFRVDDEYPSSQGDSRVGVAPTGDGGFLVVWESDEEGTTDIVGRYFDEEGTGGEEFRINETTAGRSRSLLPRCSTMAVSW